MQVLNAIYEEDFLGFSYGFRPGRSQHDALDALWVGIMGKKVNWVLDAGIRGFYDTIDHGWLMKFVEQRIADPRMLRLIRKWLRAGVSQDGRWSETKVGTPQGAVASPLLANAYPLLCFGPVGESVAKTSCKRRLYRRPLRGRLCRGIPAQARSRAIPDGAEVPNGAVRFKLAPGENAVDRVRTAGPTHIRFRVI